MDEGYRPTCLAAPAGSFLAFDTNIVHRGSRPAAGQHRDSINMEFVLTGRRTAQARQVPQRRRVVGIGETKDEPLAQPAAKLAQNPTAAMQARLPNLPLTGFGTANRKSAKGEALIRSLLNYFDLGGRGPIDTASMYGNHATIREAFARSHVPRDQIFVVTKVNTNKGVTTRCAPCNRRAHDAGSALALARSIASELGAPPDLLLIHTANNNTDLERESVWRGLIEARHSGLTRFIGVSNFDESQILQLRDATGELPAANELELHPWVSLRQKQLAAWCQQQGIRVIAYNSLGGRRGSRKLSSAKSVESKLARKINATAAQVLLRWSTQQGVAIIPGATSRQHISENLASSRFTLSPEDVAMLEMAPKPTSFATWSHKGGLLLQEPAVASTTRAARWAHYAMPEAAAGKDLILDVGLNIGQDTRNYLAAGHRVIALEANPALAQRVGQGQPFANAIRSNRLLVLNKAVTDRGVSTPGVNQSIIFWVNQYDGERSSVSRQKCACSKLPCRYRRCVPVHVPVTTCAELIHEYGVPLYVKVDIEGFDWACVASIATLAQQTGNAPRFLSAEEMPVRLLRQLYNAGYDSVKCQDQRPFWTQNDPMLKGSGNFGDQVVEMSTQTRAWRTLRSFVEEQEAALKVSKWPSKFRVCPKADVHLRFKTPAQPIPGSSFPQRPHFVSGASARSTEVPAGPRQGLSMACGLKQKHRARWRAVDVRALIVSTPQRFVRAAQQAELAGLHAERVAPLFLNASGCPGSMSAHEWSLEQAMRNALRAVVAAGAPRVVLEDDVTLTSSREAVATQISEYLSCGYQMGQLGSCGLFMCAHATLWTPDGAKLMLQRPQCGSGTGTSAVPWDKKIKHACRQRHIRCRNSMASMRAVQPVRLRGITAAKLYKGTRQGGTPPRGYFGFGHFVQDRRGVKPYIHANDSFKAAA